MQLSFAVVPLLVFTNSRARMGRFYESSLGEGDRGHLRGTDHRFKPEIALRFFSLPTRGRPRLVSEQTVVLTFTAPSLMYRRILVALDHTTADHALLTHVSELAAIHQSALLLVHVADGWVARNFDQLNLADSEEMRDDWRRLEETATRLRNERGVTVETRLALGILRSRY
jgi:hypothetical protein